MSLNLVLRRMALKVSTSKFKMRIHTTDNAPFEVFDRCLQRISTKSDKLGNR